MAERYIITDYIDGNPTRDRQGLSLLDVIKYMGWNWTRLDGVYKHQVEVSYLLTGPTEYIIDQLLKDFNQECALSLSLNRGIGLVYPDYKYEHLGQWTTSTTKPDCDSYSYNPANGLYLYVR